MDEGSRSASARQARALARAVTAGSRSAARALERLFAPATVAFGEAMSESESPDALATTFEVVGPLDLRLAVVAPRAHARALAAALATRACANEIDRWREAFDEVANIVASAFLNGVAELVKQSLVPSVPAVADRRLAELVAAIAPGRAISMSHFSVALPGGVARGLIVAAPAESSIDVLAAALTADE